MQNPVQFHTDAARTAGIVGLLKQNHGFTENTRAKMGAYFAQNKVKSETICAMAVVAKISAVPEHAAWSFQLVRLRAIFWG